MLRKLIVLWCVVVAAAALLVNAVTTFGQSSDQYLPTAILTNEITGSIAALDLGDPRSTRHYYAFEATPGDLTVTVNTRNLNGDVDIFTAVTFRPLTKISIYANTIPPEVTKSLYFRTRQILILRVEARTPNDDPGTYRITFGGSFQPFSGGIAVADNSETTSDATGERNSRRLSSVGATLPRPPEEAKPEEPKPAETVSETAANEESVSKKPAAKPRTTRRNPRSTARNRPARTPRSKPAAKPNTETSTTESTADETGKKIEEAKPAEGEEKSGETPAPKPAVQEPAGPRLIIERTDGTRIERPMSTVRRVVVETNVIVILLKTGRSERVPMSAVVRMAIEP